MKRTAFLTVFLFSSIGAFACEVCEKNQPKPLRGITHGIGPTGTIDYIIIAVAAVLVSVALFWSIKFLVRPKEGNSDHIKNIVLNEN